MRDLVKTMSLASVAGLGFAVQAVDLNELVQQQERTNQAIEARQPGPVMGSNKAKGPITEVLVGQPAIDELQKESPSAPAEETKPNAKPVKDGPPPAEDLLTTVKPVATPKTPAPGDMPVAKPVEPAKKPAGAAALLGNAATASDEIKFSGDNLNVDAATGLVTLEGNAKVWDKKMTTTADRMVLTLNADQKPEKVEAIGNVLCIGKTVSNGKDVEVKASGGYSIYRAVDQTLVLTEKPRLITGRSYMEGMEKIIYDQVKNTFNTSGGKVVGGVMPDDFSQPKDDKPKADDKKPADDKPKADDKKPAVVPAPAK
jgi:lipopolysaccharide transport protein LptA